MTDRIRITGLQVETRIGVGDEERSSPQRVSIDIEIVCDLKKAGESDDINDTIDYGRVAQAVAELARGSEAHLLERLAEKIAASIGTFPGVTGVTVEVAKQSPPITEEVGPISVRIDRP